ncbi:MAG: SDR family oxidoreductase [Bacteroidota bacterium]
MSQSQNVLVTGSSSGFGLLIARTLLTGGHTVFATMRAPEGRNAEAAADLSAFADETSGTVHILDLDVTSDASVDQAVQRAISLEGHIDVVVNNAGFGGGGLTETFTVPQFETMFDVNVFGVQRVNRAVLPAMRARGKGLLVHISSTLGRVVLPFSGAYTASKFAVEGLAESLRYELAPTGVDVAIVQPGGFGTNFFDSMVPGADDARAESYGPLAEMPGQMWSGVGEMLQGDDAPDPQEVADAVATLIATPAGERPLRVVVDPMTGGDGAKAINETAAHVQQQTLEGFGMEGLLSVQPAEAS